MPEKCCVVACRSGYKKKKIDDTEEGFITKTVFNFPAEVDLCSLWIKFISRNNWKPSIFSGVCIDHFEEKFIKRGKRNTLDFTKKTYSNNSHK